MYSRAPIPQPIDDVEQRIRRAATRQQGVVSRQQLVQSGLSSHRIRSRVKAGQLRALGGSVFAVGHDALTPRGWEFAAILAAPRGSALAQWTSAFDWSIVEERPSHVHVAVAGRSVCALTEYAVAHRPRHLPASDIRQHNGLPTLTPERTLEDLARVVGDDVRLLQLVEAACTSASVNPHHLIARCDARRRAPGSARLRTAAVQIAGPVLLRSKLERKFRRMCLEAGLPRYEPNVRFGRWQLDALWRQHRVAVELDIYRWHSGRTRYLNDRAKGLDLADANISLLRVAGEDLEQDPARVMQTVANVLATAAASLDLGHAEARSA